jgi:hypothetical protein
MMEEGDTGDTAEQEKAELEVEGIRLKKEQEKAELEAELFFALFFVSVCLVEQNNFDFFPMLQIL